MEKRSFVDLLQNARTPQMLTRTETYLEEHLRKFVKKDEAVLICFPNREPDAISGLLEKAVLGAEGIPVFWGPDFTWKALLRQAFGSRARVIIGPPMVVLGLTKLARFAGTPLFIRHVLTAGYPCEDWMIDGIVRGLDCKSWGCFGPGTGAVVAGFSCGHSWGVHLRDDCYGAMISDANGNELPEGELGELLLYEKERPDILYSTMERLRLNTKPCACGSASPRLMDIQGADLHDPDLASLTRMLLSWTSILDCKVHRGECGLELEVITFPGEKLPKFPTCAKRVVRAWNPDKDEPFWYAPRPANPAILGEKH